MSDTTTPTPAKEQTAAEFVFDIYHEWRCTEEVVMIVEINGFPTRCVFDMELDTAKQLRQALDAAIESAEKDLAAEA